VVALFSSTFYIVCSKRTRVVVGSSKSGSFNIFIMGYVTSFIVLLLLSTWGTEASLGEDSSSDQPSAWQYIVIALSLAFTLMTGKG
jgi:drug/metabolite transporter (DMT)-like permease